MVLVNQGLPSGPLSSDTIEELKNVRLSVLALWFCGILRLFVDNPFNGVATLFAAICGTYTFMNDRQFEKCYEFISQSCTLCGGGGAQCMGPLMTISLINAVFDTFRLYSLVGVASLVPLLSLATCASIALQIYIFVACWRVFRRMVQPFDSPLPRSNIDNRPFLQQAPRQYVGLGDNSQSNSFVPFAGEGRRLV